MPVLALIPARGGSKGIPRKNILDIAGRPLIAWSIEAGLGAMEKGYVDKVIVSTDDEEIAEVSRKYGAEVPFMRPEYLAADTSKSVDVMIHAYEFYKEQGIVYDTIVLLQPTTPLRTPEDIGAALEIYRNSPAKSLITCYKEEYICDLVAYHKDGDKAVPLHEGHNKGMRRQELEPWYVRNGAIYITDSDYMLAEKKVFDDVPAMYVMSRENSVNLDTMDDVELLRWKIAREQK